MILYLSRKGTLFIGSVEALPHESSLLPASTHIERMYAREGKQPYRESLRRNEDCIPPLYGPPSQPILRLLPRVLPAIFRVQRHRAPSSPISPFEMTEQALRLIASIPLIQRRKKCCFREEKAPSRSGFPLSMYVVLKTRYVNPNIHIRRY